jgi:hypothetical protein
MKKEKIIIGGRVFDYSSNSRIGNESDKNHCFLIRVANNEELAKLLNSEKELFFTQTVANEEKIYKFESINNFEFMYRLDGYLGLSIYDEYRMIYDCEKNLLRKFHLDIIIN